MSECPDNIMPVEEVDDVNNLSDPIVQYMYEMIDVEMLGVCFEVHRSARLGNFELGMIDDAAQKEFTITNQTGLDVFGQLPIKKLQECMCPKCERRLAANRFAPHLEKCMGMGRNSSRIASRRLQASGQLDNIELENDVDYDWTFDFEKKNKKLKREKDRSTSSPRRTKLRKAPSNEFSSIAFMREHGRGSRSGTPNSTSSGDMINNRLGPTLQALETLGRDEKVALLRQTCGVISEHSSKMCTLTDKCLQHTDEERKAVRILLLGDANEAPWNVGMEVASLTDKDDIVGVDTFEDIDANSLLGDMNADLGMWDQDSNISGGSDSLVEPVTLVAKPKKSKNKNYRR